MRKMTDDEIFELATERIKMKSRYFKHFISFVVVNTFVIVINTLVFPTIPISLWTLSVWGMLVLLDGFNVFTMLVIDTDENVQREFRKLKQITQSLTEDMPVDNKKPSITGGDYVQLNE